MLYQTLICKSKPRAEKVQGKRKRGKGKEKAKEIRNPSRVCFDEVPRK